MQAQLAQCVCSSGGGGGGQRATSRGLGRNCSPPAFSPVPALGRPAAQLENHLHCFLGRGGTWKPILGGAHSVQGRPPRHPLSSPRETFGTLTPHCTTYAPRADRTGWAASL